VKTREDMRKDLSWP